MEVLWGFFRYLTSLYLHLLLFSSFCSVVCCWTPLSPTPLQDDMRLERRRCIQVILFSRVFRREIFDVLDLLFVSIPFSAPPELCCSNLSRIFKNLQNFKIFLCPLKLFCNCPGRRWFPWMEILFPKFYAKKNLPLKMLTKCTAFSLVLFVITPF